MAPLAGARAGFCVVVVGAGGVAAAGALQVEELVPAGEAVFGPAPGALQAGGVAAQAGPRRHVGVVTAEENVQGV